MSDVFEEEKGVVGEKGGGEVLVLPAFESRKTRGEEGDGKSAQFVLQWKVFLFYGEKCGVSGKLDARGGRHRAKYCTVHSTERGKKLLPPPPSSGRKKKEGLYFPSLPPSSSFCTCARKSTLSCTLK